MDSTITHNHHQLKKNVPELHAGDRVKVHQKIQEGAKSRIQVFEGLVIKTQHGRGINGTFTVRRISLGVGVEKCFPLHLPSIVKIEKVKSAEVRRAKLFYVRDLVGKRAQKLKKEKDDAKVWEDVIVTESDKTQSSNVKAQNEEQITEEEKEEKAEVESKTEEKNEKAGDQSKADEAGTQKPEEVKEEKERKPESEKAKKE